MFAIKESKDQQTAKAIENGFKLLKEIELGKTEKPQKKKTVTEKMENTMKKKTSKKNKPKNK